MSQRWIIYFTSISRRSCRSMFSRSNLSKPDGPTGFPGIGMLPQLRRAPAEFLLSLSRTYGDVSYFKAGLQEMYLLNRPDLIQEVLVTSPGNFMKSRIIQRSKILLGEGLLTSEGDFHLRQRRLVQPAFYRDRLIGYSRQMVQCAMAADGRWKTGETRDISEEMMRLTLSVVGKTLFSRDVEGEARDVGDALGAVFATFGTMLLPFAGVLEKLPLPAMRRAAKARDFLDRTIYSMIAERRASGEDRGDLLSMLLLAVDEDKSSMTDKQVRDEALTLFLAGHETTANALTWAWYLLSQNPGADAKMRTEIADVLGDRFATYEDVPSLKYTEQVFAETLRLYPPAWALARMVKQQYRLYNYELHPGDIVIMSPYVMHRHPRYYADPERFDPDRFTPEAKAKRPKFTYFPFGGGPRVCIGERFAWMEGVLLLATIAQRWRFHLVPGHRVEPQPQITLRAKYGMKMTIEAV